MRLDLTVSQYQEVEKLSFGAFQPLAGFMNEEDLYSCVRDFRLSNGKFFPLPVYLDVSQEIASTLKPQVDLFFQGRHCGTLHVDSVYKPEKTEVAEKCFGTLDQAHPGVKFLFDRGEFFVGGRVENFVRQRLEYSDWELTPQQTRELFAQRGWKTVVGFQTRNAPHRAHEYLLRVGLEVCEGLFVQPLVGWKKIGDFTPEAVKAGYEALISQFFPKSRVAFSLLTTNMRYAGPREALLHAVIRRNYGCTHFIVGRDHAGVGGYYEKYAAHEMTDRFKDELGIQILKLHGPFYCDLCGQIATEKTCQHWIEEPSAVLEISGTEVRKAIFNDGKVDARVIRPEVVNAIGRENVFVE